MTPHERLPDCFDSIDAYWDAELDEVAAGLLRLGFAGGDARPGSVVAGGSLDSAVLERIPHARPRELFRVSPDIARARQVTAEGLQLLEAKGLVLRTYTGDATFLLVLTRRGSAAIVGARR